MSERTFGSDSGLEQSGDELEATREVEVHEEEESMEELNVGSKFPRHKVPKGTRVWTEHI